MSGLKQMLKGLLTLVLVFGIAGLVLAYFMGYYDFSFLDRYKILYNEVTEKPQNVGGFGNMFDIDMNTDISTGDNLPDIETIPNENDSTDSDNENGDNTLSSNSESGASNTGETSSVVNIFSTDLLADTTTSFEFVSDLAKKGYKVSDEIYNPKTMKLAKLTFGFKLPTAQSLRRRAVSKITGYEVLTEDGPYSAVYSTVREKRPAIELYMGYILIDNGKTLYLIDSKGNALCTFDDNVYSPAYTRDKDGKALFSKTADDGEVSYYYLSDDGKYFMQSDYNDETDNRGLYFDYPKWYGVSESEIQAVKDAPEPLPELIELKDEDLKDLTPEEKDKKIKDTEEENKKIQEEIDKRIKAEKDKDYLWGYQTEIEVVTENKSETDSKTDENEKTVEKETKMLTTYKYNRAYNFSDGIACVLDTKNRGGMYFINENFERIQDTFILYLNQHTRYVIWDYQLPASNGFESIGFYYYDHGLTRVRYQIIDAYNWQAYKRVKVANEEDKLIRADGSIYTLPTGYTLKGYSDGMILLERDGKYGFMDYTGAWIAEPVYKSASAFVGGLAVLETEDGRFGMIDTKGNIVLTFTYDYISSNSSGVVAAYRVENGWTVFEVMAK